MTERFVTTVLPSAAAKLYGETIRIAAASETVKVYHSPESLEPFDEIAAGGYATYLVGHKVNGVSATNEKVWIQVLDGRGRISAPDDELAARCKAKLREMYPPKIPPGAAGVLHINGTNIPFNSVTTFVEPPPI